MNESGYIKFRCEHILAEPPRIGIIAELIAVRDRLFQRGLIGVYPNGIGYGNISARLANVRAFAITGSATGGIEKLSPAHFAKVTGYDFERNWLLCEGAIVASSESMTHAAVYEAEPRAGAVIHVHHFELWKRLLHNVPTTPEEIEYGTPAMALAVRRLFETTNVKERRLFVTAGHAEGIFTFGESLERALEVLLDCLNNESQPQPEH
jgi:ribulose-5-phosphate 4-epimerase/fuculose-1-phosphate aldolase